MLGGQNRYEIDDRIHHAVVALDEEVANRPTGPNTDFPGAQGVHCDERAHAVVPVCEPSVDAQLAAAADTAAGHIVGRFAAHSATSDPGRRFDLDRLGEAVSHIGPGDRDELGVLDGSLAEVDAEGYLGHPVVSVERHGDLFHEVDAAVVEEVALLRPHQDARVASEDGSHCHHCHRCHPRQNRRPYDTNSTPTLRSPLHQRYRVSYGASH